MSDDIITIIRDSVKNRNTLEDTIEFFQTEYGAEVATKDNRLHSLSFDLPIGSDVFEDGAPTAKIVANVKYNDNDTQQPDIEVSLKLPHSIVKEKTSKGKEPFLTSIFDIGAPFKI